MHDKNTTTPKSNKISSCNSLKNIFSSCKKSLCSDSDMVICETSMPTRSNNFFYGQFPIKAIFPVPIQIALHSHVMYPGQSADNFICPQYPLFPEHELQYQNKNNNFNYTSPSTPPIVPNNYFVNTQIINGERIFILLPDTTIKNPIYRVSFNRVINKYIYEPYDPTSNMVLPSTITSTTYIYDYIPNYGYGLVPYLYNTNNPSPLSINGYCYIPVPTLNGELLWVYAPVINNT